MKDRIEIRMSGAGGQGLVLGGLILAEAAAIYEGKNATQSQSYGPESRGGASKSEVIIATGEIDYPKATHIDLLLVLTQKAAEKYISDIPKGSAIIYDLDLVEESAIPKEGYKIVKAPIVRLAKEKAGKELVANIVALGLIRELTNIVEEKSLEEAVLSRVPKGTEELNKKALQIGKEAAHEYAPDLCGKLLQ